MYIFKNVSGTQKNVSALELDLDTVYIRNNIRLSNIDFPHWIYDEIQLTYPEYADYLQNKVLEKEIKIIELEMGGL